MGAPDGCLIRAWTQSGGGHKVARPTGVGHALTTYDRSRTRINHLHDPYRRSRCGWRLRGSSQHDRQPSFADGRTRRSCGAKAAGSADAPAPPGPHIEAELLRHAAEALDEVSQRARSPGAAGAAIGWLQARRPGEVLGQVIVVPADAQGKARLLSAQADPMADGMSAVLDGLGLSEGGWERGRDIAVRELRAAAGQGWEPL